MRGKLVCSYVWISLLWDMCSLVLLLDGVMSFVQPQRRITQNHNGNDNNMLKVKSYRIFDESNFIRRRSLLDK
jgi:hypothetical protein